MAVELLFSWTVLLVVSGPPKAKMAPFWILICDAAPMPLLVRPKLPPATESTPVKLLAVDGFKTQVPPSVLVTARIMALAPLALSTSREVMILLSTFPPRNSKVRIRPAASPCIVLVNAPASSRGPLPDASMRQVRLALSPVEARLQALVATSPCPTYTKALISPLPRFRMSDPPLTLVPRLLEVTPAEPIDESTKVPSLMVVLPL